MRLPFSRIYRAFPELDAFDDAECERFVLRARSHRRDLVMWPVGVGCAGSIVWVAGVIPCTMYVTRQLFPRQVEFDPSPFELIGLVAVGALVVLLGSMLLRDRLLIRAIRGRVDLAACPSCRHSLLGLPLLDGGERETVRCPECGSAVLLDEIGLSHGDLIPRVTDQGDR